MEQGVRALWQPQAPGLAELEVEENSSAEANAVEYLGEDVHNVDANATDDPTQYSDDWALPSERPRYQILPRRADDLGSSVIQQEP